MAMTLPLPLAPVVLMPPWNFPIAIPSWKSGGALMAGCTVVFKPSSLTPLCAAKVCEVLEEAGLPPGVFNMVTGAGGLVGSALVDHPDITAISFTGGVETGRDVYVRGAKRLIKVGPGLGGENSIPLSGEQRV